MTEAGRHERPNPELTRNERQLRDAITRALALTATGRLIDPKALLAALNIGEGHE